MITTTVEPDPRYDPDEQECDAHDHVAVDTTDDGTEAECRTCGAVEWFPRRRYAHNPHD
jgi:hypothetical protein